MADPAPKPDDDEPAAVTAARSLLATIAADNTASPLAGAGQGRTE
jgi:hypothetical protein